MAKILNVKIKTRNGESIKFNEVDHIIIGDDVFPHDRPRLLEAESLNKLKIFQKNRGKVSFELDDVCFISFCLSTDKNSSIYVESIVICLGEEYGESDIESK